MNVAQLRKAIADLPDDMPVAIESECGWSEVNLYVCDAHLRYTPKFPNLTPWLSEGHVDTSSPVYRDHVNTTALLFSEWGNDGEDITPRSRPDIVDGEIAPLEITAADRALGPKSVVPLVECVDEAAREEQG